MWQLWRVQSYMFKTSPIMIGESDKFKIVTTERQSHCYFMKRQLCAIWHNHDSMSHDQFLDKLMNFWRVSNYHKKISSFWKIEKIMGQFMTIKKSIK